MPEGSLPLEPEQPVETRDIFPDDLSRVFAFPKTIHIRRHGPMGYAESNYDAYKPWLRDEFQYRCAYCMQREQWQMGSGQGFFVVEHFVPQVDDKDAICDYDNLINACDRCNQLKGKSRSILNPGEVAMADHLEVDTEGAVYGLTKAGQFHIRILGLDRPDVVEKRKMWLETLRSLKETGRVDLLRYYLGYPEDLPNLRGLRPPNGNHRPAGIAQSAYERRLHNQLPPIY